MERFYFTLFRHTEKTLPSLRVTPYYWPVMNNPKPSEPGDFKKVTFTIPTEMLAAIDQAAADDDRNRSQWIALQLKKMLKEPPDKEK